MDILDVIYAAFLMTFLIMSLITLIRNDLVYKARMKALSMCDTLSDLEKYDAAGSYTSMWMDLTKWRFKDFFPEFTDE